MESFDKPESKDSIQVIGTSQVTVINEANA
jgi:hypothetical protein